MSDLIERLRFEANECEVVVCAEAATPAPVAQKVPGVSARHAAKVWCSLKRSEKKRILKNLEVFVEQENGEDDLSWSMRALEALYSEPSRVSAMLAAAQSQEGKP